MRYGKRGKIHITREEQEMFELVRRQYVTNREFLEGIGFDISRISPKTISGMIQSIRTGERGLEMYQWKKLNELYQKTMSSQLK